MQTDPLTFKNLLSEVLLFDVFDENVIYFESTVEIVEMNRNNSPTINWPKDAFQLAHYQVMHLQLRYGMKISRIV